MHLWPKTIASESEAGRAFQCFLRLVQAAFHDHPRIRDQQLSLDSLTLNAFAEPPVALCGRAYCG